MEKGQFLPEKLVTFWDIAKGLGEVALEFISKQLLHETPSDHFIHEEHITDTVDEA